MNWRGRSAPNSNGVLGLEAAVRLLVIAGPLPLASPATAGGEGVERARASHLVGRKARASVSHLFIFFCVGREMSPGRVPVVCGPARMAHLHPPRWGSAGAANHGAAAGPAWWRSGAALPGVRICGGPLHAPHGARPPPSTSSARCPLYGKGVFPIDTQSGLLPSNSYKGQFEPRTFCIWVFRLCRSCRHQVGEDEGGGRGELLRRHLAAQQLPAAGQEGIVRGAGILRERHEEGQLSPKGREGVGERLEDPYLWSRRKPQPPENLDGQCAWCGRTLRQSASSGAVHGSGECSSTDPPFGHRVCWYLHGARSASAGSGHRHQRRPPLLEAAGCGGPRSASAPAKRSAHRNADQVFRFAMRFAH